MKKIALISILLIVSLSAFAQGQKTLLPRFTAKGKSYFGIDLGRVLKTSSYNLSRETIFGFSLTPALNYQYNVINRLAVGGKIASTMRFRHQALRRIGQPRSNLETLNVSVFARYYPFSKKGYFIEGDYILERNFLLSEYVQKVGVNPGYSFVIGRNRNFALDLKMNINYKGRQFRFMDGVFFIPTIGFKLPLV